MAFSDKYMESQRDYSSQYQAESEYYRCARAVILLVTYSKKIIIIVPHDLIIIHGLLVQIFCMHAHVDIKIISDIFFEA